MKKKKNNNVRNTSCKTRNNERAICFRLRSSRRRSGLTHYVEK
jgi:hypothetical protein